MLAARLEADPVLRGGEVSSAGTSAWDGSPAAEGSYLVALERGLDLSHHRARVLTAEQVQRADLVLTMTTAHSRRVADLGGASKVATLREYAGEQQQGAEIPDPFGGDVADYRRTAELFDGLLDAIVARLGREVAR